MLVNQSVIVLDRASPIKPLVQHDVPNPSGLALDWLHSNLYWTDADNNRIDLLSLAGPTSVLNVHDDAPQGSVELWRKTLFNTNLDQPRAIAVDPREEYRQALKN